MIVVNPYGSLVADVRHDKIVATIVSSTTTKYSYYLTIPLVSAKELQCVVTVINDSSGNFVSAERTNT